MGREHAAAGVRWLSIFGGIALAAALGAAAWFVLLRGDSPLLGSEAPSFRFDLRKVTSVAVDRKPSNETLEDVAAEVHATLDAMYLAGFVDPAKWEEGTFPEVIEAFAPQAASGAGGDLDDLTLGEAAGRLESVTPGESRLDVEFLVTQEGEPFAAVATTKFRAEGKLTSGGAVDVRHEGRYVMRPFEGRWVIVTYRVDGKIRPAAAPTPGGSP